MVQHKDIAKTRLNRLMVASLVVGIIWTALALSFIFRPSSGSPVQQNNLVPAPVRNSSDSGHVNTNSGSIGRLKIPKIGVDAQIESMGFTQSGDMESPNGPQYVGWYKFGARPGEKGSAVIDGHYGRWINGEASVFDNLNQLSKDDNLYITDQKGQTTTFTVRASHTYKPNDNDTNVFISNDGKAHLNLITCEGVWNEVQKTYSNRLVVFADADRE